MADEQSTNDNESWIAHRKLVVTTLDKIEGHLFKIQDNMNILNTKSAISEKEYTDLRIDLEKKTDQLKIAIDNLRDLIDKSIFDSTPKEDFKDLKTDVKEISDKMENIRVRVAGIAGFITLIGIGVEAAIKFLVGLVSTH